MTQPAPPDDSNAAEWLVAGAVAALMTVPQFTAIRVRLSLRLSSVLSSMFRQLGSWRDPDSERFVAQAVPLVQGAQRALASVTSAYIADQASRANGFGTATDLRSLVASGARPELTSGTSSISAESTPSVSPGDSVTGKAPGAPGSQQTEVDQAAATDPGRVAKPTGQKVAPPAVPDSESVNLRGVDPAVVYHRPFIVTRVALSKGEDLSTAVDRGTTRLEQIVEGDMQQTHARASRAAMEALPEAVAASAWRRVPQGARTCALCILASTKLYKVETLNPLHNGCDCGVLPVFGSHPSVGPERKAAVKAALEEIGAGRNYRNLRGLVVEHGELGPMLVRPKDHFSE